MNRQQPNARHHAQSTEYSNPTKSRLDDSSQKSTRDCEMSGNTVTQACTKRSTPPQTSTNTIAVANTFTPNDRSWEHRLTLLFAAIGDSLLPEAAHTSVQPEDIELFKEHNGIDASGVNAAWQSIH